MPEWKEWLARADATRPPALDLGLLALRLGMGLMMLLGHGWSKAAGFSEKAAKFSDPLGLGPELSLALVVFAEVFCSLLVALGLYTRVAAVPLLIAMLVAGLVRHAADPFGVKEKALLYAVAFLALIFMGPGRFSLGRWLAGKGPAAGKS